MLRSYGQTMQHAVQQVPKNKVVEFGSLRVFLALTL